MDSTPILTKKEQAALKKQQTALKKQQTSLKKEQQARDKEAKRMLAEKTAAEKKERKEALEKEKQVKKAAAEEKATPKLQMLRTQHTYEETIQAIRTECSHINLRFSTEGDGRMDSAVKETMYLSELEKGLTPRGFTFVLPKERFWYDVAINGIPINLKLTGGGTDNAFNKVSVIYTLSAHESEQKNMNFNQWYKLLKELSRKAVRDRSTEYHYLVVDKSNKDRILLKSMLDIHEYKPNPSNDLQINWNVEFDHQEEVTPEGNYLEKYKTLIKTVQTSVRRAWAGMKEFAEADVDADFM